MNIPCSLETRHSEKKNTDYQVLVIKLTDSYEKTVFLEPAELALLKVTSKGSSKPSFLK